MDNNLNQCEEFNYVFSNQCWKDFYEIKFPNDVNVLMKLLVLGGLFDAALFPYVSYPDNKKGINVSRKKFNIFLVFFINFYTIFICFFIIIRW